MPRVLVGLVVVGLLLYSLTDLLGSEEEDRAGLPRWLWIVIVVLLPIFGPIAWIVTKQTRRRNGYTGRTGRPGRGPRRPAGPVAPDDDPDFLWRLDQEKRRRAREQGDVRPEGHRAGDGDGDGADGSGPDGAGPDDDGAPGSDDDHRA
ncbi:PLD nuclease N-terminal domain-containing protein [Isoptericola jiangsuensis]|uniref:PLD nuclease N-terminal domain-containing protein n=1 Tax=Isoptericola jiangsuensis TaxID=548579 RepID=UPI003AABA49D